MSTNIHRVLGLMSGSSLDGLDIAYCEFETSQENGFTVENWEIAAAKTMPYTKEWQDRLAGLIHADAFTLAQTSTHFSRYSGELVNEFLDHHDVVPDFIAAHGHTVFHFPDQYFTTQIGEGAALAMTTGYPVICDFRTHDVALGGQGAPIASIADKYLLGAYDFCLNLGGIANITAQSEDKYIAFDVSGANQILNAIVAEIGMEYDDKGTLASSGNVIEELFERSNQLDFLKQPYPKTLDNQWVSKQLTPLFKDTNMAMKDRLRTACEHIAFQIAQAIQHIIKKENLSKSSYRLLATGGGAYNDFLMSCIQNHLEPNLNITVQIPEEKIIGFKESAMIALMGVMRLENIPNCMSSVTGAKRDTINGGIHQGWKNFI